MGCLQYRGMGSVCFKDDEDGKGWGNVGMTYFGLVILGFLEASGVHHGSPPHPLLFKGFCLFPGDPCFTQFLQSGVFSRFLPLPRRSLLYSVLAEWGLQ